MKPKIGSKTHKPRLIRKIPSSARERKQMEQKVQTVRMTSTRQYQKSIFFETHLNLQEASSTSVNCESWTPLQEDQAALDIACSAVLSRDSYPRELRDSASLCQ